MFKSEVETAFCRTPLAIDVATLRIECISHRLPLCNESSEQGRAACSPEGTSASHREFKANGVDAGVGFVTRLSTKISKTTCGGMNEAKRYPQVDTGASLSICWVYSNREVGVKSSIHLHRFTASGSNP